MAEQARAAGDQPLEQSARTAPGTSESLGQHLLTGAEQAREWPWWAAGRVPAGGGAVGRRRAVDGRAGVRRLPGAGRGERRRGRGERPGVVGFDGRGR